MLHLSVGCAKIHNESIPTKTRKRHLDMSQLDSFLHFLLFINHSALRSMGPHDSKVTLVMHGNTEAT